MVPIVGGMRKFRVSWRPNALHPIAEWHFGAQPVEFSRHLGAIASVIAMALGEALQMHYAEHTVSPLKGCIGERFHGRSNGSNGQHGVTGKGQIRARTSPQPT